MTQLCKYLDCTCVCNLKVYLHLQAAVLSQNNLDALTEVPSHPAFSWHLVPLANPSIIWRSSRKQLVAPSAFAILKHVLVCFCLPCAGLSLKHLHTSLSN